MFNQSSAFILPNINNKRMLCKSRASCLKTLKRRSGVWRAVCVQNACARDHHCSFVLLLCKGAPFLTLSQEIVLNLAGIVWFCEA